MSKQVFLPFEYAPWLLTYQNLAFLLGIIQGNANESIIPWLSSRYINCWFSPTGSRNFSFNEDDHWAIKDKILFQRQRDLCNDQVDKNSEYNCVTLFKNMIQLGYYPHGVYNEEFIPGKRAFQKGYYAHDFILCGYDDDVELFMSAGYLTTGKYQQFSIPYECMEHAITSLHRDSVFYEFFKYNEEAKYQLDCSKIILDLFAYLNSTNSQSSYMQNRTWGLNALINIGEFVIDMYEKHNYIDHRCTRAVMEFKKLMHMRINCLLSTEILIDQKYLEYSHAALCLSESAHLLGVKFRLTEENSIAYRINDVYKKVVEIEKEYLPSVLLEMQYKIGHSY